MNKVLMVLGLVISLSLGVTPVRAQSNLAALRTQLNVAANTYDILQISYEACMQDKNAPVHVPIMQATPDMTAADIKAALQEYVDATVYLQGKIDACKAKKGADASVCWGFRPKDSKGQLNWKAMPCDGE